MDSFHDPNDSQPMDVEAITFTEALAHSKAFENYLFDNMAQRRTTHTMTPDSQPIVLTPDAISSRMPEEVRDIFGNTPSVIDSLSVFQEESHDLSYTFMQFNVNGDRHTLTSQSDEAYSIYTRPNAHGDTAEYRLSQDATLGFLAGLVYAREYDQIQAILEMRKQARLSGSGLESSSATLFSMEESNIEAPRIGNSGMIEQLIMTLGHFDGLSEIRTSSLLPVNDKLLFVSLTQAESPQLGYVSNELDLSILDGNPQDILGAPYSHLGLSQQLGDIKAFKGEDFNDQIGEASLDEQVTVIQPEKDTQAWSLLCAQFAHSMKSALEPYRHHDDTY